MVAELHERADRVLTTCDVEHAAVLGAGPSWPRGSESWGSNLSRWRAGLRRVGGRSGETRIRNLPLAKPERDPNVRLNDDGSGGREAGEWRGRRVRGRGLGATAAGGTEIEGALPAGALAAVAAADAAGRAAALVARSGLRSEQGCLAAVDGHHQAGQHRNEGAEGLRWSGCP